MARWQLYEEETLKAFRYKTDKEIADYLCEKGYKRNKKQVSEKRLRMGITKYIKHQRKET
jgi:hypothetical protein